MQPTVVHTVELRINPKTFHSKNLMEMAPELSQCRYHLI